MENYYCNWLPQYIWGVIRWFLSLNYKNTLEVISGGGRTKQDKKKKVQLMTKKEPSHCPLLSTQVDYHCQAYEYKIFVNK